MSEWMNCTKHASFASMDSGGFWFVHRGGKERNCALLGEGENKKTMVVVVFKLVLSFFFLSNKAPGE